jgi:hypothetical protein
METVVEKGDGRKKKILMHWVQQDVGVDEGVVGEARGGMQASLRSMAQRVGKVGREKEERGERGGRATTAQTESFGLPNWATLLAIGNALHAQMLILPAVTSAIDATPPIHPVARAARAAREVVSL